MPVSFLVEFCEHVAIQDAEVMVHDLRYWTPDRQHVADRTYSVTVARENKLALFKKRLAYGEQAGWWRWRRWRPSPER